MLSASAVENVCFEFKKHLGDETCLRFAGEASTRGGLCGASAAQKQVIFEEISLWPRPVHNRSSVAVMASLAVRDYSDVGEKYFRCWTWKVYCQLVSSSNCDEYSRGVRVKKRYGVVWCELLSTIELKEIGCRRQKLELPYVMFFHFKKMFLPIQAFYVFFKRFYKDIFTISASLTRLLISYVSCSFKI